MAKQLICRSEFSPLDTDFRREAKHAYDAKLGIISLGDSISRGTSGQRIADHPCSGGDGSGYAPPPVSSGYPYTDDSIAHGGAGSSASRSGAGKSFNNVDSSRGNNSVDGGGYVDGSSYDVSRNYAGGSSSSSSTAPLTNLASKTSNSNLRQYEVGQSATCGTPLQNLAGDLPQQERSSLSIRPQVNSTQLNTSSEIILHVYDLHSVTKRMGIGTFHLGIEVYAQEIFFSVEGILSCPPGGHLGHIHRETIFIGRTFLRPVEVKVILEELGQEWMGSSYSIIGRNCQTFAVAFVESLGMGSDCIPAEFRRQSDLGSGWRDTGIGGAAAYMLNSVLGSGGSKSLGSQSASNSGSGKSSG